MNDNEIHLQEKNKENTVDGDGLRLAVFGKSSKRLISIITHLLVLKKCNDAKVVWFRIREKRSKQAKIKVKLKSRHYIELRQKYPQGVNDYRTKYHKKYSLVHAATHEHGV